MKTAIFGLFLVLLTNSPGSAQAWDAKACKKPSADEIKKMLAKRPYAEELAYEVTQERGTEQSGTGRIIDPPGGRDHPTPGSGIFVDIVSGEPLFSTLDQYHSGTGWPSFSKPLVKENVVISTDPDGSRDEVRSKCGDSHLGHVFDDGPAPTGKRYCMDSAALRFIPASELKKQGYGEYVSLFAKTDASKKK